jgi:tripartite-type tricarboxylate transporter receptor subunit TctC
MAPHLSQALGQSVVVENRPGAGGLIGTDYVSKQPADGYTLLVSHASVHIYAAATRNTMPFDRWPTSPTWGCWSRRRWCCLCAAQSPYQTLVQYVTKARTKPVRYGTSGIGSANHLFGELLKIDGQALEHDHVPYQGSAPAMQDLLGGQIDSVFDPITTNVAHAQGRLAARAGRVHAQAAAGAAEHPDLRRGSATPSSPARSGWACRHPRACPRRSRSA